MARPLTDAALVKLYNKIADRLTKQRVAFDYTTVIATMATETGMSFLAIEDRLVQITAEAAR